MTGVQTCALPISQFQFCDGFISLSLELPLVRYQNSSNSSLIFIYFSLPCFFFFFNFHVPVPTSPGRITLFLPTRHWSGFFCTFFKEEKKGIPYPIQTLELAISALGHFLALLLTLVPNATTGTEGQPSMASLVGLSYDNSLVSLLPDSPHPHPEIGRAHV